MKRFRVISCITVLAATFLTLIPLGRIAVDWVQVSQMVAEPAVQTASQGFDWVVWNETDGAITAGYVFPEGPAEKAGLREGDIFYMLEYQQFFNADDLMRAIEGISPGSERVFSVQRDGAIVETSISIQRYPTFLYPLSPSLWRFSLWGFTLGAFIHMLGLAIAGPLALRSRQARSSLLLILVSSLWIFATLLRLVTIEALGPPEEGSLFNAISQVLTVVSLAGWIGFPALLLHRVLNDTSGDAQLDRRFLKYLVYVPPLVLGAAAIGAGMLGRVGPLTLQNLVAPILFYVCTYVAAAAALVLTFYLTRPDRAVHVVGGWSRAGSFLTFAVALLAALSVLGIVPLLGAVTDTTAGWLVVSTQLLTIAPVTLVSIATLKYGKVSTVLSRTLTYATVLGLIFFAFVGGMTLMEPFARELEVSLHIAAGAYVVCLLVIFERLGRRLRSYFTSFFATERQRSRQILSRFQERMRDVLDLHALAQQTVQTVSEAFGARSAALFLRPATDEADTSASWIVNTYHPEPPYFTERRFHHLWPYLKSDNRIWARNPELSERSLPDEPDHLLRHHRAALAVPIRGNRQPIGLLVLGPRQQRHAVYNLEDLDLLRSLSGQLALAVERLSLVEREKALARETAEAELVALRAQINPHFLFNALNTIAALIEERPDQAEATVEHLSAIFRYILQTGSKPFVPLETEFKLVEHYLQIEKARFGERLSVDYTLPAAICSHPVPAFSIQTLAENAVKHGIAKTRDGGRVQIEARPLSEGGVEVSVSDTGVGIPALFEEQDAQSSEQSFFGMGLRNVSSRLQQLYGEEDLLQFTSTPTGTTARLRLPADRSGAFTDREATHTGLRPDATAGRMSV